ncbi:MAG: NAD(P)/FAD-dependent oxidoreductase [Salinibacterium sp.]|nr:MAG: NAD(P)/FAD-dependent oxidoreductase [Salinibacterium sp.]
MAVERFVIVGGGLAGATAAGELREQGFDGEVHLFAAEPHSPYIRPPLSKEYFTGKEARDSIFVHPDDWYRERELVVSTASPVVALADHAVTLESGREVWFDRVLLATGSSARRLEVAGSSAAGIHYLRTVEDSETLRDAVAGGGQNVVVIGGGWIGLEIAAAARGYGNTVTVLMRDAIPLASAIGEELGTMFRELHEANGVTFEVRDVLSFDTRDGSVTGVVTNAGTVPATLVVVGIGADPNVELADAAGLEVEDGILVDEHLAASANDVFAAGDVANAYHPVVMQRMRNEHWANALGTGKVAARSMLGQKAIFDEVPYFYTDQYDLGMEYSGYPLLADGAKVVYRGNRAKREFIAFWVAEGSVVAGMNVNVWDVNEDVKELITSGRAVDEAKLADESVALSTL